MIDKRLSLQLMWSAIHFDCAGRRVCAHNCSFFPSFLYLISPGSVCAVSTGQGIPLSYNIAC